MKKSLVTLAALAVFGVAAQAEDGISANLALTSKYKYRGQDQSDTDKYVLPAIQGGFDYSYSGFYVGNWNSSIGFAHGTEMDFYGGYAGEFMGFSYDVGLLQYYYPGSGAAILNTRELYGSVGWSFLTLKYSHTISSKYFGFDGGRNTGYLNLSGEYEIMPSLTLSAGVGQTFFSGGAKDSGAVNYTDYSVGVSYDLGNNFSVSGSYVGANKDGDWGDVNKDRLIVSVSTSF